MALEVEDDGVVTHLLRVPRPEDKDKRFLTMAQAFAEIYNNTFGLQAVEMKGGESPFKNPAKKDAQR